MIDTTYARVIMYVPSHKPRKMKNATVSVAFFLPDRKPTYAYGCDTFLSYSINEDDYEIYNPQKFEFNLDDLTNHLFRWHLKHDKVKVTNFCIVKVDSQ